MSRDVYYMQRICLKLFSNNLNIKLKVFSLIVLNRVGSKKNCTEIVTKNCRNCLHGYLQFS
ncbi:uncharacterized protein DS421_6g184910 [Arachis hypogaea]|nr:uncharacterized protein DS421_6g184910 [Arachis hypogaea]